jgi:tetratricopeptide (TPR) repeat protein
VGEVRAEIERIAGMTLGPLEQAALTFARGAFALRSGDLAAARSELTAATGAFDVLGERQAANLARCDACRAIGRSSPRTSLPALVADLNAIIDGAGDDPLVCVVATTVRAATHAQMNEPANALDAYCAALARSEGMGLERGHVLVSFGTLYATLGVHGAAEHALEHSLELAHRLGDTVTEAIAHGQLGSIALSRRDLDRARRHLGAQELLANRLGDVFGRTRALTYLAEVALEASQPEAALALAKEAGRLASSVVPPLSVFASFAERIALRGAAELDGVSDEPAMRALQQRFATGGVTLGAALVARDMARSGFADAVELRAQAIAGFASVGLPDRIAELLLGEPTSDDPARAAAIAALAQGHPRLADALEIGLVYSAPTSLRAVALSRMAGQRNLARLAELHFGPPGLVITVFLSDAPAHATPPDESRAASVSACGPVGVWAWPLSVDDPSVSADLARLEPGARGVVVRSPSARIARLPFAGDAGVSLAGIDLTPLFARALAAPRGNIERGT